MVDPGSSELRQRIDELDRELKALRGRLAALERLMGAGSEHPTDETTVRKKVVYDWQG